MPLYLAVRGVKSARNQYFLPKEGWLHLDHHLVLAWMTYLLLLASHLEWIGKLPTVMVSRSIQCFVVHKAAVALKYSWMSWEQYDRVLNGDVSVARAWNVAAQFLTGWVAPLSEKKILVELDLAAAAAGIDINRLRLSLPTTSGAARAAWHEWLQSAQHPLAPTTAAGTTAGTTAGSPGETGDGDAHTQHEVPYAGSISIRDLLVNMMLRADASKVRDWLLCNTLTTSSTTNRGHASASTSSGSRWCLCISCCRICTYAAAAGQRPIGRRRRWR
jgi:hypothetical protein